MPCSNRRQVRLLFGEPPHNKTVPSCSTIVENLIPVGKFVMCLVFMSPVKIEASEKVDGPKPQPPSTIMQDVLAGIIAIENV